MNIKRLLRLFLASPATIILGTAYFLLYLFILSRFNVPIYSWVYVAFWAINAIISVVFTILSHNSEEKQAIKAARIAILVSIIIDVLIGGIRLGGIHLIRPGVALIPLHILLLSTGVWQLVEWKKLRIKYACLYIKPKVDKAGSSGSLAASTHTHRKVIFTFVLLIMLFAFSFLPVVTVDAPFIHASANVYTLGDSLLDVGQKIENSSLNIFGIFFYLFLAIPLLIALSFIFLLLRKTASAFAWTKCVCIVALVLSMAFFALTVHLNNLYDRELGNTLSDIVKSFFSLEAGIFLLAISSVVGLLSDQILIALMPAAGLARTRTVDIGAQNNNIPDSENTGHDATVTTGKSTNATPHVYCSMCGQPLTVSAKFCEHCGTKVI